VRGLGGSLLYFLDPGSRLGKVWDIDFDPIDNPITNPITLGAPDDGIGLTVVDHVSQSMHYEEMLSWLLFYTSLFDLRKTPQVDVADPGGIVRSQVVETADGALRIALNASQSVRTQSSRFLNDYFGSGVQHIAFATGDILGAADRLRRNGVATLPIPENYYDDLAARTDLPAARIDELRARNILYDKDEHGEYLQLYTRSFKDLFFLEIVERRGYAGFGAVNAPIRLNAQSRLAQERTLSAL
jgi:4-hydroxyphenylpyruvate dioxygenase